MRQVQLYLLVTAALALWVGRATAEPCFGFFELRDDVPYAVEGETWTFDHGAEEEEGWVPEQVYDPPGPDVVRWQTLDDFADDGLPPGAPIISGTGMIWAGLHEDEAEALCFECGLGYGYGVQRMRSPWIPYTGGDVMLEFLYFQDMPVSKIGLRVQSDVDPHVWSLWSFDDGNAGPWNTPETFLEVLSGSRFLGASALRVEVYLSELYGGVDEDCSFDSQWGAFGVDDVQLSGGASALFDFEGSAQGWETLGGNYNDDVSFYFEINDLASYNEGYENWVGCGLDGNVMTVHGPGTFVEERLDGASSPIIDLRDIGPQPFDGFTLSIETLEDYPGPDNPGIKSKVYYRYYPVECATGGPPRWSNWIYVSSDAMTTVKCEESTVTWGASHSELPELIQVHLAVRSCAVCCQPECIPIPK